MTTADLDDNGRERVPDRSGTPTPPACVACGRQPKRPYLVEDLVTGEVFAIHRPATGATHVTPCFRLAVGPRTRHKLIGTIPEKGDIA